MEHKEYLDAIRKIDEEVNEFNRQQDFLRFKKKKCTEAMLILSDFDFDITEIKKMIDSIPDPKDEISSEDYYPMFG